MGMQYHVTFIAGNRMPDGHDWIYLPGEPSTLLLRVGADARRVFYEVAEMLETGMAACSMWVA